MESALVQLLSPFLPRLLGKASEVGAKVGGAAVDAAWEHARRIWDKLRPAIEAKPAATEAAADVAAAPDDADAQAALRLQLKKLLADDPALATQLGSLLEQARGAGVVATGKGGVAAGEIKAQTGGVAAGIIHGGVNTTRRT
jgi:hypothetical protein